MPSVFFRKTVGLSGLALCALGIWVACSTPKAGVLDAHGYVNSTYGYRVGLTDPEVFGADWGVDNFRKDGSPKESGAYMTRFFLDLDGDGQVDEHQEEYLYDLRLKNKRSDAVIWLRSFPVSDDLKDKDLRVLMQSYVDEIAGAGYEAVRIHPMGWSTREVRYAAAVVERGPGQLASHPAYSTTLDIANIDQIKLTPGKFEKRVQLVIAAPPFVYTTGDPRYGTERHFAVRLVVGYANLPEDFEKDLPTFQRFLERIEIKGKRGFNVELEGSFADGTTVPGASPAETADAGTPAAPSALPGDAGVNTPADAAAPVH
jgi:hypothetical protein